MANRVKQFFGEAQSELKKVTWPSKDDLKASTLVVIVATAFLAVYIGVIDVIVSRLIRLLIR